MMSFLLVPYSLMDEVLDFNPMARKKVKKPPASMIGRYIYRIENGELVTYKIIGRDGSRYYDIKQIAPIVSPTTHNTITKIYAFRIRLTIFGAIKDALLTYKSVIWRTRYMSDKAEATRIANQEQEYLAKTLALANGWLSNKQLERLKKECPAISGLQI